MSATPPTSPRQLTVMVFRDNLAARTFRVPLRWLTQFGWILVAMVILTAISIGVAVRFSIKNSSGYRGNNVSSSARVTELETQLKEAQSQLQALTTSNVKSVTQENPEAPVVDPSIVAASSPLAAKPYLFRGFPDQIKAPPADESQIPIAMSSPVIRWEGKILKVGFNLEYVSKTPGGQQGRLLILARGPGALLTHPPDVVQPVGSDILINPNRGEYYSVSRFRETRAEFGPLSSKDMINEIEVIVLNSSGQMLIHRKLPVSSNSSSQPPVDTGSENTSENADTAGAQDKQ